MITKLWAGQSTEVGADPTLAVPLANLGRRQLMPFDSTTGYPVTLARVTTLRTAAADVGVATARFFRVLSDPNRLAILELLLERPRTVSELVDVLGCPQSRVSNHLACLRWCEFVDTERQGRQITYFLREPGVKPLIQAARELSAEHCEHLTSCTRIGPEWI